MTMMITRFIRRMLEMVQLLENPFDSEDWVDCILWDYEEYTMLMYRKGEKIYKQKTYKQMIFKDKKVFLIAINVRKEWKSE